MRIIADTVNPFTGIRETVLLDKPERVITVQNPAGLDKALYELELLSGSGKILAGYISYEASCMIAWPEIKVEYKTNYPLLMFGVFNAETPVSELHNPDDYEDDFWFTGPDFRVTRKGYEPGFEKVQNWIRQGQTYQINYTISSSVRFFGNALTFFRRLLRRQKSSYNFYMEFDKVKLLSLSPELFFSVSGSRITTRPMKGTLARTGKPELDINARENLELSEKNRAENAMITDVFRNDLGKICKTGSVVVEKFFEVEEYPTLYQTTSTISGDLKPEIHLRDIIAALLPSASVTGAPKKESVEKIRQIEDEPRGVYTGTFGVIRPDNDLIFNIAIRSLEIYGNSGRAGFGSGLVYDSDIDSEYNEILQKSVFLDLNMPPFFIFETILVRNGKPVLWAYHLDRLAISAREMEIPLDPQKAEVYLKQCLSGLDNSSSFRLKLMLYPDGHLESEIRSFNRVKKTYRLMLSDQRVSSGNLFLGHKTSRRSFFDKNLERAVNAGYDEVLFLNEKDEVTECSVHNIMIRKEGRWYTPPLECGLLPGTFRRYLIGKKVLEEKILHLTDIQDAEKIAVMNSLRGINYAVLG